MQTDTATEQPKPEPVWGWRFHNEEALLAGLDGYNAYLSDGLLISHYGEKVYGDESDGKARQEAMRRRAEIDRCMDTLEYPFFWRILDMYYRRGCCDEHKGWCRVAEAVGLRGDPKSKWDRSTFELQVDWAVTRLWRVHERRRDGRR